MDTEVFKIIEGYNEKYLISNMGRVLCIGNLKTFYTEGVVDTAGHKVVTLKTEESTVCLRIDRLVGNYFVEGKTENNRFIKHLDSENFNCKHYNLQWVGNKDFTQSSENKNPFRLKKHKIRKGRKLTPDDVLEIRTLYHSHSTKSIAEKFGVTTDNISHIIKGKIWRGLPVQEYSKPKRIFYNPDAFNKTKLNPQDVLQIRSLYHTHTAKWIADKFNVSEVNIFKIVCGHSWKHLPLETYSKKQGRCTPETV